MAGCPFLAFFVIFHLLLLSFAKEERQFNPNCPYVHCGKLGNIFFPFSNRTQRPDCGLMVVDDCDKQVQKIQLTKEGPRYNLTNIAQDSSITLEDQAFQNQLNSRSCESLKNMTFPSSPILSFQIISNLSLFRCTHKLDSNPTRFSFPCNGAFIYYNHKDDHLPSIIPPSCSLIQLPVNKSGESLDLFNMLTSAFTLQVIVPVECFECHWIGGHCRIESKGKFNCTESKECNDCHSKGGHCSIDENKSFQCEYKSTGHVKKWKLGLGLGGGIGLIVLIALLSFCTIHHRNKQKYASANIHSRNNSSSPSSKSDLETGTINFSVPIFSYRDLAEATNDFNREKELGDGGFGTVYYGMLRDGREVAVKRLYEHNYRRVEQFMNEVKILTCLHHKNLVSLYGCTSRHSPRLLLVYEFVPNGTVADHLHGDRAELGLLSWHTRMNIAIETASALAYLHASDIIHRDVKTNNILLDSNFCVKVADFGLSRLFPNDVTHISTAPQGTPGYVDPEYHQCYQLTDKSDVYSFGVVLIELISSMPAVDMTRHRHEINLANLAINKIQKCAFDELIDPCLGYQSDEEVKRSITSVAELAFLCLQQDKEMRPSMEKVLKELNRITNGESNLEKQDDSEMIMSTQPPPSPPHCDEESLLKNTRLLSSPISVTDKWVSSGTTPNASG